MNPDDAARIRALASTAAAFLEAVEAAAPLLEAIAELDPLDRAVVESARPADRLPPARPVLGGVLRPRVAEHAHGAARLARLVLHGDRVGAGGRLRSTLLLVRRLVVGAGRAAEGAQAAAPAPAEQAPQPEPGATASTVDVLAAVGVLGQATTDSERVRATLVVARTAEQAFPSEKAQVRAVFARAATGDRGALADAQKVVTNLSATYMVKS